MFKKLFNLQSDSWKIFDDINTVTPHCVTFGISIPSASIGDWQHTCVMLNLTLTSSLAQTDPRFRVIIAGHEKPELQIMQDERVQFIRSHRQVPKILEDRIIDKNHKRDLALKRHCENGAGYFMPLDADDLVHRDLVKYILSDDNRLGYSIRRGYALDWQNRILAPVPGAWNVSFDNVCGSSTIFYLQTNDFINEDHPSKYKKPVFFTTSHAYWRVASQEWGRPLSDVPFPACIYILNHSQNLSFSKQRTHIRQNNIIENIKKHQTNDMNSILSEFSMNPALTSNQTQYDIHHNPGL